jgi:hypothetical protein
LGLLGLFLTPAGNSKLMGVTGSEVGTVPVGLILREPTLEAEADVVILLVVSESAARGSLSGSRVSPVSLRTVGTVGGEVEIVVAAPVADVELTLGLADVDAGFTVCVGEGVGCCICSDKDWMTRYKLPFVSCAANLIWRLRFSLASRQVLIHILRRSQIRQDGGNDPGCKSDYRILSELQESQDPLHRCRLYQLICLSARIHIERRATDLQRPNAE